MDSITLKGKITESFTDEEFFWFCQENKDLRIERNSNLEIIIMSPVTTRSSFSSSAIFGQLYAWNLISNEGIVFDSSSGFTMPDRSVLSPDVSWVSKEKFKTLSEEEKDRFAPICPEFVIEVRSKSDSLEELKKKMQLWISNGAQEAWLVDPIDQITYLRFANSNAEEIVKGFNQKIESRVVLKGFILDLSLIKL
ncbi:MAG: Uma2 family endonuclease [Bacteroidetes bacterium]|nr:Uma2 family endonuclease [Bacteroidota bacterium]